MSTEIHQRLVRFLEQSGIPFGLLEHPPCRTSAESAAARAMAGAPGSVGAKALIVKATRPAGFVMLVLPGDERVSNENARRIVGKFRFATPDEIAGLTDGLAPGMIPPFTDPIFPKLQALIVDERVGSEPRIGFNAAELERSIVMRGSDYFGIANPTTIATIVEANDFYPSC
jgi:Ala-tRNA(Pro) deacylase